MLTVNDAYADLLVEQLGIPRPAVVMNCPEPWSPPSPAPDLIRGALGLPGTTRVVLYQGKLMSDRGIEPSMDAILAVPDAVLVLLGFGVWRQRLEAAVDSRRTVSGSGCCRRSRRTMLLDWTASADVMVMAIQPTSLNHRYTTPQKLFESLAAGVPVVAATCPAWPAIVRGSGVGRPVRSDRSTVHRGRDPGGPRRR